MSKFKSFLTKKNEALAISFSRPMEFPMQMPMGQPEPESDHEDMPIDFGGDETGQEHCEEHKVLKQNLHDIAYYCKKMAEKVSDECNIEEWMSANIAECRGKVSDVVHKFMYDNHEEEM